MDPNTALARLRAWAEGDGNSGINESDAMELFAGLDEWLSKGSFLPDGWRLPNDWQR